MGGRLGSMVAVVLLGGGMVYLAEEGVGAPSADELSGVAVQGAAEKQELPDGVTEEMVALGEEVYADAGLCVTCHGPDGEGTPVGPPVNDQDWTHIDGSFESLVQIIDEGVEQPEDYAGAMLPRGGSGISDEEVEAVAAYVWVMSQGG